MSERNYIPWKDPMRRDPSQFVRAVYALVRAEIADASEDDIERLALKVDDELYGFINRLNNTAAKAG